MSITKITIELILHVFVNLCILLCLQLKIRYKTSLCMFWTSNIIDGIITKALEFKLTLSILFVRAWLFANM